LYYVLAILQKIWGADQLQVRILPFLTVKTSHFTTSVAVFLYNIHNGGPVAKVDCFWLKERFSLFFDDGRVVVEMSWKKSGWIGPMVIISFILV
jgi:hypothetical protein